MVVMDVPVLRWIFQRVRVVWRGFSHLALPLFEISGGFCFFFDQRAMAVRLATALRCLAVIVSSLRLPPIRPPFRPISAMAWETSERRVGSAFEISSASPTDSSTTRRAFRTVSRLGVLIRFGIPNGVTVGGVSSKAEVTGHKKRFFSLDPRRDGEARSWPGSLSDRTDLRAHDDVARRPESVKSSVMPSTSLPPSAVRCRRRLR
jgi:hypothetical protein